MRCVYCDHALPNDAASYASSRCDFCGNPNNWGNVFLHFRIRNLIKNCEKQYYAGIGYRPLCLISTALDFTDKGVINFKPQVSSFYEALIRCSRSGFFEVTWHCDELFREDIIIEKMGVYVNIPESYRKRHNNNRVAFINSRGVHIYDEDNVTVELVKELVKGELSGGKKEDDRNLYSEFAMTPYDKVRQIMIRSHDTFTYVEFSTKSTSPVRRLSGALPNIPTDRVIELFRGTPAENLIKVK
ncbi:hypothetical protein HS7_14740 [Sulfolobales archaeon HS-7]|nr:hypothetical protein HS7_14740 [Sulfolobales archaeon HS-7]